MSNLIFGKYETIADVRQDSIFKWIKAKEYPDGNIVLLQLLCPRLSGNQIRPLFDFFDNLRALNKRKLFLPEYTLGDKNTPLGAVYRDIAFEPLSKAIANKPEEALEWWHKASEQLFHLHNKKLVHGYVSPENFIVINEEIFLMNFGYAPLLRSGNEAAIQKIGEFCAPEVKTRHDVTRVADVYGFAKTIAHFYPKVETTAWYQEATDENPENRPRRMRDVHDNLQKIITDLKLPEEREPTYYNLTITTVPSIGGKGFGSGSYPEKQQVKISAFPAMEQGYFFDHWEGDLNDKKNPTTILMDSDKNISAVFASNKVQGTYYKLEVESFPSACGTVNGSGYYPGNEHVKVTASPAEGYRFDRWAGDINDTSNPITVVMNSDKKIIALFSPN